MPHILFFYVLNLEIKGVFSTYSAPQLGQAVFEVFLHLSRCHLGWCRPGCSWQNDRCPFRMTLTSWLCVRVRAGGLARVVTIKYWGL